MGFTVGDGHIKDLEKAAGLNTLLWVEFYIPIIPFSAAKAALARISWTCSGSMSCMQLSVMVKSMNF